MIYLDHAAATPLDARVARAMVKVQAVFGNPSSIHSAGREAREALETARRDVGRILEARADELIFTSSGTESDNLAILGVAHARGKGHIITTTIEHHAVLVPCRRLESEGYDLTYVPCDVMGRVDPEVIQSALRPDTILVSVHYANNEIGTIQPIKAIARKLHERSAVFHIDACQASGFLPLNVQELGVDLMTLNASKMYGPKGIGVLYVRRGIDLVPVIVGGSQERVRRAGTESVALAVGFAEALKIADGARQEESERLVLLRDWTLEELQKRIPDLVLNGDLVERLPNNINISIPDVDSEMLLLHLDRRGVLVSTGAACTVASNEVSHVVRAIRGEKIGLSSEALAKDGNIRLSLGRSTTKRDLKKAVEIIVEVVGKMRVLTA